MKSYSRSGCWWHEESPSTSGRDRRWCRCSGCDWERDRLPAGARRRSGPSVGTDSRAQTGCFTGAAASSMAGLRQCDGLHCIGEGLREYRGGEIVGDGGWQYIATVGNTNVARELSCVVDTLPDSRTSDGTTMYGCAGPGVLTSFESSVKTTGKGDVRTLTSSSSGSSVIQPLDCVLVIKCATSTADTICHPRPPNSLKMTCWTINYIVHIWVFCQFT